MNNVLYISRSLTQYILPKYLGKHLHKYVLVLICLTTSWKFLIMQVIRTNVLAAILIPVRTLSYFANNIKEKNTQNKKKNTDTKICPSTCSTTFMGERQESCQKGNKLKKGCC